MELDKKINELVYTLPYYKIINISDNNLREVILRKYEEEKEKFFKIYFHLQSFFDEEKSLEYNYYNLEQMESESISDYLFPNDKVLYYPIIKELKAKTLHICAISGVKIPVGAYYEQFKAFLYNAKTRTSYVSKKINYEIGADFEIPYTLHEFEDLYYRINNAYELNLDYEHNIFANIRGMSLVRLNRKK